MVAPLLLAGCTQSQIYQVGGHEYAPTNPDAVVFYADWSQLKRPHVEIALIDEFGVFLSSNKAAVEGMRKRAARIGAHAVVHERGGNPSTSPNHNPSHWEATAIRFLHLTNDERRRYALGGPAR